MYTYIYIYIYTYIHKYTCKPGTARYDLGQKRWFHLHCNSLQHIVTHCNTPHHTATHCDTLRHTATTQHRIWRELMGTGTSWSPSGWRALMRCRMLPWALHFRCNATSRCNNTLQHTDTRCNTLLRTATGVKSGLRDLPRCRILLWARHFRYAATTHCNNTLQHTAACCNTLPNTATGVKIGGGTLCDAGCCHGLGISGVLQQHTATHSRTLQHAAT